MTKQTGFEYLKIIFLTFVFVVVVAFFAILHYATCDKKFDGESRASVHHKKHITVIVDAGHGGMDGGAVGKSGVPEKDINLAISKKLGAMLEMTGIDVRFTRETDIMLYREGQENRKKFYDLYNRIEFSKQFENPVLISIHQNKFPAEKYRGLQVYYSKNHDDSKIIAELIQNKTKDFLQPDNNRKIKEAGRNIFLLKNIECPALIVECGFLSNSVDEKNLCDEEYQKKIAFVIFSALLDYVSNENVRNFNEV